MNFTGSENQFSRNVGPATYIPNEKNPNLIPLIQNDHHVSGYDNDYRRVYFLENTGIQYLS